MNQKARILVVDDNEAGRYALARCLRQAGHEVLEAATGQEGLRLVSEHAPALVLLDVRLPDLSGIEVCRQLKTHPDTAHTPVIQISAYLTAAPDRIEGLDSGADAYLTAPFEPLELLAQVQALLRARRAEAALRQSEQRLRLAQSAGQIGIHDFNPITGELHWDERLRELWGLGPLDPVNYEVFLAGVHPEDRAATEVAIQRALDPAGDGYCCLEYRLLRGGQTRWIAATGQVTFAKGRAVRLVGTAQDITERKAFQAELERQVAARTRELQETNAQLNDFCYSIAHDLKAPLRAQAALANVLEEDFGAALGTEGRHYARRIHQAAQRQGQLVSDLLAHMSVSRADFPLAPVSLETIVAGARSDLALEEKQKQAQVEVGPVNGQVLANAASLHLVVLNLLSNALKFVPDGTPPRVRIWAEVREGGTPPAVAASNPASSPHAPRSPLPAPPVRLWVADKGIGIAPEHYQRIFGVFQRLHSNQTYPGTGIGLAIVKRAVERMGGQVGVESTLGQGSRFWVELPQVPAKG